MKTYAKLLRAGIATPVAGTIPLLLYVLFGPANGNPIIVSGNHGHRVAESVYPRGRVYAYVMPAN